MSVRLHSAAVILCIFCSASACIAYARDTSGPNVVTVDITPAHTIATFRPMRAIGSTVDKEPAGSIPALYSKHNVRAMLAAGLGWLSYRLYTELSDQDWHWNPSGSFSEGNAGYWTSAASASDALISDSFGYRLPHRGNTTDQGNNESYSRLDDGDPSTYWKSNPYLTSAYTGEADNLHPQWVVVDLERPRAVDQLNVSWAQPYARSYSVGYWNGDDPINDPGTGTWISLRTQRARHYQSGSGVTGPVDTVHFQSPVTARYFRLLMERSSNTCDTHKETDKRNCVGYAVNEVSIGAVDAHGAFHDFVRHTPCGGVPPGPYACGSRQTPTYVSSVDPWHRAADRVRHQEQPGLDLIARSGLTRALPAMYPVPMLYSTPENAVAEVRYLRARGYPISGIELGEEPDGQYAAPEDYGTLYVQWARAIHKVDPTLKLGGPVFSGVNGELQTWPDAAGNISWLNRFLNYLRRHRAMSELAFMSFEHYPLDDGCVHAARLHQALLREPSIIKGVVNAWRSDGLPRDLPLYITEANFSSVNFTQLPMEIEGALWQVDYMASSLVNRVSGTVYYQYEPVPMTQNPQCPRDWGNLTMFVANADAKIRARGAQFYASQMLTQQWVVPGDGEHELYPASTSISEDGYPLVTAYAVRRPDGLLSVLLVNKDTQAHTVALEFVNHDNAQTAHLSGNVTIVQFGPAQYVWRQKGALSGPAPDNGPVARTISVRGAEPPLSVAGLSPFALPGLSITVIRGAIQPVPNALPPLGG